MNISPSTKLHIETAAIVFGASFLSALATSIKSLSVSGISWSLLGSLVVAAIGAALRAAITNYFTSSVGNGLKTGSIAKVSE